jgi:hypothetical protein
LLRRGSCLGLGFRVQGSGFGCRVGGRPESAGPWEGEPVYGLWFMVQVWASGFSMLYFVRGFRVWGLGEGGERPESAEGKPVLRRGLGLGFRA